MIAIWDSGKPGEPDEPEFWGKPKQKRVIIKGCYSKTGPWVHFKVNEQHRLAYLSDRQPIRKKKKKKSVVN
jgi:hypothetical protein